MRADRGQLEQLLINLTLNARDAMQQGGQLIIETANVVLDAAFDALPLETDVVMGPYVLLTVRDTGHGMDADTLAHIFEPFFTSKPIGQGTGLGLATVYGICEAERRVHLGGERAGPWATFRVYLPAIDAREELPPAEPASSMSPGAPFLQKPFSVEAIEAKLHAAFSPSD